MSRAQPQMQVLVDPKAGADGPLEGTKARSRSGWTVHKLRLHQRISATFPADDALARCPYIAIPVGALAPGHRHDEAIAGRPHDDRGAINLARAPAAVLDHAVQWEQPRPGQSQHERIDNPSYPAHSGT